MMRPSAARRPVGRRNGGALRSCYLIVGTVTLVLGVTVLYVYMFQGLRKVARPDDGEEGFAALNPAQAPRLIGEAAHAVADKLRWSQRCPTCECEDASGNDPDAWLDRVHDEYPKMVPSHYGMVHGVEPYERPGTKLWDLHVIPTDDWYERAKKATDRCDLELTQQTQGAENGLADKITWVSALFDLKRGEAGMGDFQRGMDEYYRRFQVVLDRGFPMVIFIPREFESHLKIDYSRVKVIYMNASDLKWYFPYYDRVQSVRTSKLWVEQGESAGWLIKSPQARLEGYNPLVMAKLMMLKDAARMNVWGTRYHMWMDAGHLCAGGLSPEGMNMYKRHMSKGMLVTHWPYGTQTEVHGMTDKAMHLYIGTQDDPLIIVRGGIFGGQLPHIECVLKAYVIALHQSLTDGYMGTEECIWAMIFARFPHLFAGFDNNSLGNHGDNCASFQKNIMEEEEIGRGTREVFVSPPIPEKPSWWGDIENAPASVKGQMKGNAAAGGGAAAGGAKQHGAGSTAAANRHLDALKKAGAVAAKGVRGA